MLTDGFRGGGGGVRAPEGDRDHSGVQKVETVEERRDLVHRTQEVGNRAGLVVGVLADGSPVAEPARPLR